MNRKLCKIDFAEMEKRVLAGGVLPKGLAQNYSFLRMYGSNVADTARKVSQPVPLNVQDIRSGRFSS